MQKRFIDYFEIRDYLDNMLKSHYSVMGSQAISAITGAPGDRAACESRVMHYKAQSDMLEIVKQALSKMNYQLFEVPEPKEKP